MKYSSTLLFVFLTLRTVVVRAAVKLQFDQDDDTQKANAAQLNYLLDEEVIPLAENALNALENPNDQVQQAYESLFFNFDTLKMKEIYGLIAQIRDSGPTVTFYFDESDGHLDYIDNAWYDIGYDDNSNPDKSVHVKLNGGDARDPPGDAGSYTSVGLKIVKGAPGTDGDVGFGDATGQSHVFIAPAKFLPGSAYDSRSWDIIKEFGFDTTRGINDPQGEPDPVYRLEDIQNLSFEIFHELVHAVGGVNPDDGQIAIEDGPGEGIYTWHECKLAKDKNDKDKSYPAPTTLAAPYTWVAVALKLNEVQCVDCDWSGGWVVGNTGKPRTDDGRDNAPTIMQGTG